MNEHNPNWQRVRIIICYGAAFHSSPNCATRISSKELWKWQNILKIALSIVWNPKRTECLKIKYIRGVWSTFVWIQMLTAGHYNVLETALPVFSDKTFVRNHLKGNRKSWFQGSFSLPIHLRTKTRPVFRTFFFILTTSVQKNFNQADNLQTSPVHLKTPKKIALVSILQCKLLCKELIQINWNPKGRTRRPTRHINPPPSLKKLLLIFAYVTLGIRRGELQKLA